MTDESSMRWEWEGGATAVASAEPPGSGRESRRRERGSVVFAGVALATAPGAVMTPRPATERLVAEARRRVGRDAARVVDVGTGSGAVAIAIATVCRGARVWATDTSAAAVRLARANVRRHALEDRVFVRQGDLLEPLTGRFDLIVANLPYLAEAAAAARPELRLEPAGAVFAAGDGLGPYRRLVDAARDALAADGVLVLQLHREVLVAGRRGLPRLAARLRSPVPEPA